MFAIGLSRICLALLLFGGTAGASAQRSGNRHSNEEYGIRATFPAGRRVCAALSGNHPTGFYAWLNRRTDCNVRPPAGTAAMNVTAMYNAAFYPAPRLAGCENGGVPRGSGIDLRGIAFPGRRSLACALRAAEGSIEVHVTAQGGRWPAGFGAAESRTARIDYYARLITRRGRARTDVATFRDFLSRLVIRPPRAG